MKIETIKKHFRPIKQDLITLLLEKFPDMSTKEGMDRCIKRVYYLIHLVDGDHKILDLIEDLIETIKLYPEEFRYELGYGKNY